MIKRIMTPKEAAVEMRAQSVAGLTTGILFGPERTGLFNDDLALADTSLTVPLNPAFSSLNLAQAVLLIGYEWYQTADATPGRYLHTGATRSATKDELVNLFGHLEAELEQCGFFSSPEKKPSMIRAIRNCFQRMDLTEQEVRTFHGIVSGLVGRRKPTPKE
jgi:tRNA/rRNA methyltransferase